MSQEHSPTLAPQRTAPAFTLAASFTLPRTVKKLLATVAAMLFAVGFVAAENFDAIITDPSRAFTKMKKTPGALSFGKITLDSKGKVVSTVYTEGVVTTATKVAMGAFDEKTKKWMPGTAIEGGVASELFTEKGKVLRVQVTVGDDNKTISQILVKNTDEKLEKADPEFDAILKEVGPQTNGTGGIAYVRLELDEKGDVIKSFGLKITHVTKDTKIAMGKYNEAEKKWEAGEDIPKGLYGDIFKDLGAKTVYVRMKYRDDHKGIAEILVRQIGEKRKK